MNTPGTPPNAPAPGPSLTVVGLGNIGSFFVDHVARMESLERVVLVDPDTYEARNLRSQQITPRDVGQPKCEVQARRLRRLHPGLAVEAIRAGVANAPLGGLRASLIVACLDGIGARIAVNQAATRLGCRWLDGGVEPSAWLARVDVYEPGEDRVCFECGLSEEDYRNLPQRRPCGPPAQAEPATDSHTGLGALAAALLALECRKLLAPGEAPLLGQQLIYSAGNHRLLVNRLRRNPQCRFDHRTFRIAPLEGVTERDSLGQALIRAKELAGVTGAAALSVPGKAFAQALHCPGCARTRSVFCLQGRGSRTARFCASCGGREILPGAFDLRERLDGQLPPRLWQTPLRRAGLKAGDVLELEHESGVWHYEVPAKITRDTL